MSRILITGAAGFVGHKLMEMDRSAIASPSLRGMSGEEIRRMIEAVNPDAIIHTAAISDTGYCQANPEASYLANVQLPILLAKAAGGRKLVCFSSDQVYNGSGAEGPYGEEDVKPATVYARHKLEMEERVLDILPDAVMLRAEWMYDYYLKRGNYFMNILNATDRLTISAGQMRGITYVREVAENMEKVLRLPGGAYNFGSETDRSIYEITQEFLAFLGKDIKVEAAPARHNLWMNCAKARSFGVEFSSVEDGLRRCAEDYRSLI